MADVTLEFIAERLERIQTEQAAMRADMSAMGDDMATLRTDFADMKASITVLGNISLRIERDIVQVKDILGRLESRIGKLETA